MLTQSCKRLFSSRSGLASFQTLPQVQAHLRKVQPVLSCLYLRNDWNPECQTVDALAKQSADLHAGYHFLEIDTAQVDLAQKYYQVKAEPEFVICCLGQEMMRHTGNDQAELHRKLQKVRDFYAQCQFPEGLGRYEEFHEQFLAEFQEYEKQDDYWYR